MQIERIQKKIYTLRGKEVILDVDIAAFYKTDLQSIKTAIEKYPDHFPPDFMFRLTKKECNSLGLSTKATDIDANNFFEELPYAFTEHGVTMLCSALNNKKVFDSNVDILRAFVSNRDRELQRANLILDIANKYNKSVGEIHEIIRVLLKTLSRRRNPNTKNLSALKRNFDHELIHQILLRRLR